MTPTQIVERVNHEADTRLADVVECLLSILEEQQAPYNLVWKWKHTQLLDGLTPIETWQLARRLEEECLKIIDWRALEHPDDELAEKVADETFRRVRDEILAERKTNPRISCYCHELKDKTCENCQTS